MLTITERIPVDLNEEEGKDLYEAWMMYVSDNDIPPRWQHLSFFEKEKWILAAKEYHSKREL